MRILIIHTNSKNNDAIFKQNLLHHNDATVFEHVTIRENEEALQSRSTDCKPDIIILDRVSEPSSKEDLACVVTIKSIFRSIPILLILAEITDASYREKMLDKGVDSVVHCPLSRDEILVRLQILYKKRKNLLFEGTEVTTGNISLDLKDHIVTAGDKQVSLTKTEYLLFEHLLINQTRPVSGNELLSYIEEKESPSTKALHVHILNIRKKLEPYSIIKTIRHYGYSVSS
jgi:two-component system response regulator MprA